LDLKLPHVRPDSDGGLGLSSPGLLHVARLILVILLVIFLLGEFSGRFGGYGYGHGGVGIIGVILIIVVALMLMGRI
jgi:Protein of unknown function (DUF3309)